MFNMSTIGDYIRKKKSRADAGGFCNPFRTWTSFCKGIGTGKRNGASGQSESGTGNVWERSCTRKKGGLAGGVRI